MTATPQTMGAPELLELLAAALYRVKSKADVAAYVAALVTTDAEPGAPIQSSELARHLGTTTGTMRGTLKRLAAAGVVTPTAELTESGSSVVIYRIAEAPT